MFLGLHESLVICIGSCPHSSVVCPTQDTLLAWCNYGLIMRCMGDAAPRWTVPYAAPCILVWETRENSSWIGCLLPTAYTGSSFLMIKIQYCVWGRCRMKCSKPRPAYCGGTLIATDRTRERLDLFWVGLWAGECSVLYVSGTCKQILGISKDKVPDRSILILYIIKFP